MSRKQVLFDGLKQVVAEQQRVFATKDVSEDERMTRAHPEFVRVCGDAAGKRAL